MMKIFNKNWGYKSVAIVIILVNVVAAIYVRNWDAFGGWVTSLALIALILRFEYKIDKLLSEFEDEN